MLAARFGNRQACQSVSRVVCISQQNYAKTAGGETGKEKKPASPKKKAAKTAPAAAAAEPTPILDNKSYQVPEYYNHNVYTFFDQDTEMLHSRLPQPSSLKKPTMS